MNYECLLKTQMIEDGSTKKIPQHTLKISTGQTSYVEDFLQSLTQLCWISWRFVPLNWYINQGPDSLSMNVGCQSRKLIIWLLKEIKLFTRQDIWECCLLWNIKMVRTLQGILISSLPVMGPRPEHGPPLSPITSSRRTSPATTWPCQTIWTWWEWH